MEDAEAQAPKDSFVNTLADALSVLEPPADRRKRQKRRNAWAASHAKHPRPHIDQRDAWFATDAPLSVRR
jgi:hypothetical protein